MLALRYIKQVLRELLLSGTKGGAGVRLHEDVKASVADFLGQIKSNGIGGEWSSVLVANGIHGSALPYSPSNLTDMRDAPEALKFTEALMTWHIATWYCQAEEQSNASTGGAGEEEDSDTIRVREKNRRVAIALSKYCVYLMSSAPELLPGPSAQTKSAFDASKKQIREDMDRERGSLAAILRKSRGCIDRIPIQGVFNRGLFWGETLRSQSHDPWKVLALLWVQVLLCAAPYGDLEAHKQHLSQGGEFITHIWALLSHHGIDRWKWEPQPTSVQETSEEEEEVGPRPES
jgi:hypothetical protein